MIKNITVSQLDIENSIIIDIRSVEKFNTSHIPGSKHVSGESLINDPERYLNKSKIYYIYCQFGRQSFKVCQILSKKGYNVINIIGGYESFMLRN